MKTFFTFLIFVIILFIYLHVYFHLKQGNNLEVYEIEDMSKDKLEEICDLRQPILFSFNNNLSDIFNLSFLSSNYNSFDLKIRNMQQTYNNIESINKNNVCDYVPLCLNDTLVALNNDDKSLFISENNYDFLDETTLIKEYEYNDAFLRPYNVSNCIYDLMLGSQNTNTLFKHELNYRTYFYVSQGSIKIKLTPPTSKKYLNCNYDYENFEFSSPINPWNVKSKHQLNFNKIKCLEIELHQGQILFMPAYWWYSINFQKDTLLCVFKYRTYMNNAAILPHLFTHYLQKLNIERKLMQNKFENTVKTINTTNNNNTLNNYELFYDNPNSNNATNINSNIINLNNDNLNNNTKPVTTLESNNDINNNNNNNTIFNNDNYNENIIDSGQATNIITNS